MDFDELISEFEEGLNALESDNKDIFELISLYIKQRTMLKNRLHCFNSKSTQKMIKTELSRSIRHL